MMDFQLLCHLLILSTLKGLHGGPPIPRSTSAVAAVQPCPQTEHQHRALSNLFVSLMKWRGAELAKMKALDSGQESHANQWQTLLAPSKLHRARTGASVPAHHVATRSAR